MEVIGDTGNMISEGKRLYKKFGKCSTIKVPCTRDGLRACAELSVEGIRVNVTLVFSVAQAILASKAGAKYISPFVGRLDDISFGDDSEEVTEITTESQPEQDPEPVVEPEEEVIDIDDSSASGRLSALRREMDSDTNVQASKSREDLTKRMDSFLKDR